MIVVRNVFHLKFGKARDAMAAWKEGLVIGERAGLRRNSTRLLTDLAGPKFYTLVLETTHESLADFERSARELMGNSEWQAWYPRFTAFAEGGYREILTVAE